MPPGTLLHTGLRKMEMTDITVIDYNSGSIQEKKVTDVESLRNYKHPETVTWINIDGLHDVKLVERVGEIFNIHPLVLEDILHTDQRAKVDFFDDYIFVVIKTLNYSEKTDNFESEQISFIIGRDYVLSFQEEPGDEFGIVRERIRRATPIRNKGADYLAYSLLDIIIDSYFHVLERMGEWIEDLEEEIIERPDKETTFRINDLKRDLTFLRKNIWPVRDLIHRLDRIEEDIITKDTSIFLRDAYDHVIQVIDNIENYRDMIGNLMDLYLSNLSFKMNEVMKILTIIATIFIPITFITSLYGMNFEYMPELHTRYGYLTVWIVIVVITLGMLYYFRRKKWL